MAMVEVFAMRGNEDSQDLITNMSAPIFVLEHETPFERGV